MRRTVLALWAALVPAAACAQALPASERAAIDLVRAHRTEGFGTLAQTLAFAVRATDGAFVVGGYRVVRRPGEPFARVQVCYRLAIDPPVCGLDYLVTVDPPHVEAAERFDGLGRDLEHGPRAFVRALSREAALQRRPEILRRIGAALDPFNPYDWR